MYIVKRKKTEFKKQRVHMQADGAMKLCELTFPDLQSFLRLHINSSIYSTRAFTVNLSEIFLSHFPIIYRLSRIDIVPVSIAMKLIMLDNLLSG